MKKRVERPEIEKSSETAARLRKKYGLELKDEASKPLPKSAYDEMWEADPQSPKVPTNSSRR